MPGLRLPIRQKAPAALLIALLAGAGSLAGCGDGGGANEVVENDLAPGFTRAEVAGLQRLGATLVPGGVNFSVYSKHATRVELALFSDPEAAKPSRRLLMARMGDVWNVFVPGAAPGQAYGFLAWGPNWTYKPGWAPGRLDGFVADVDAQGNRYNPNKLLQDPYARAFHRYADPARGSPASGPMRQEATFSGAGKAVVATSTYAWSSNESAWRAARRSGTQPGHGPQDLIVYEVHPKGFTAGATSGVSAPGTFRGLGEKAAYFQDLGVTAVELLPAFQKSAEGGYWGYQTLGFFAPELAYSSDRTLGGGAGGRPAGAIDEFKWMVDQLHQRGLEVILDVVYNHTGEGGVWSNLPAGTPAGTLPTDVANLLSFRGLDNQEYYALSRDRQGYWNNTGVGNETRCNNLPMRTLILDSLHYWAGELHVDGFRFDLAPVLGEQDQNYNSWDPTHTVLQAIVDDPALQAANVRIIAEPWSLYGAFVGGFPAATAKAGSGWYEWNGRFRDWFRAFANDPTWNLSSLEGTGNGAFLLDGSYDWFHWNGRRPYHSVNFVSVHDGMTLYDVFSYSQKQNGCSPLNPACCGTPVSPFCDANGGESNNRSRDWGQDPAGEAQKRQGMRGLFTYLAIGRGTPMLLGGDEWMRTQLGNNNAWNADTSAAWFDWGGWTASDERQRMHDFVRGVLQLRKAHAYAFAPGDWSGAAPFAWKDERNQDGVAWGGRHAALHYWDGSRGPQLDILINHEAAPVTFTLPAGVRWGRLVDTQAWFDGPGWFDGTPGRPGRQSANVSLSAPAAVAGNYTVAPGSVVVLEEQR